MQEIELSRVSQFSRKMRRPKSSQPQYTFRVKKHTGEILCVSVYKTDTLTTLFEKVHNTIYGVNNYNIYNSDDYDVIPMKMKPQYAQQIIDIFSFQNNTILSIPCTSNSTVDEYMKCYSEFFPKSANSIFTQYDVFVIDSEYIGMVQTKTQQNSSIIQKIKNTIVNISIF